MTDTKPCVFIHTNHKQVVGALVAQHSFRRNSKNNERFDVKIIHTEDQPFITEREGQEYLRGGERVIWRYENLQSFTPLRFMPPQLMGYEGQAVVVDPDVFAVGDVWPLLSRDMQGKAIHCRLRTGSKGRAGGLASSVMLLDCAKLTHWKVEENFAELFDFKRDYQNWIQLKLEDRETIALFEDEWNDFDRLTPKTKMIHNTKRQTQPWKTGLPVDFTPARKQVKALKPLTWFRPLQRALGGSLGTYKPHPDPSQEAFFFGLLKECLEQDIVTEAMIRDEMRQDHVRHDALEVLERTPPLAAQA